MSGKGFNKFQRHLIRIRANYQCQYLDCNSKTNLQCHHIVPCDYANRVLKWRFYKIHDIDNGILLCSEHHKDMHENEDWKNHQKRFQKIIKILKQGASKN